MDAHPGAERSAGPGRLPGPLAWIGAGAALGLCGVALRIHNALHYPLLYGFDAPANWRYIDRLTRSWALHAGSFGAASDAR